MKSIVVFGAGKSATFLLEYLCKASEENDWKLLVCDADMELAYSKIIGCKNAAAVSIDVADDEARKKLIKDAAIVISMLPPHLHFLVANDCLLFSKHLLTASYIDEKIKTLDKEIKQKGLLFLCEMGLDPGIDHMSAMKIIEGIRQKGGTIKSFKSHCGGLISPESDDNPWHYKITWNPANIVMAGSSGAVYKQDNKIVTIPYEKIFDNCKEVNIPGLYSFAYYPNRDSLSYTSVYKLDDINTFIRTTLRHPAFCRGWNKIINMGLTNTDDNSGIKDYKNYNDWYLQKRALANKYIFEKDTKEFEEQIDYLGLANSIPIDKKINNSAGLLQSVLEQKLFMKPYDKDLIVMLHEVEYELNGENKEIKSCLVIKGEDQRRTAMAKTVGLPLGIAAKLILQGKINLTGLHIPVLPEIYLPVLKELEAHRIIFTEENI